MLHIDVFICKCTHVWVLFAGFTPAVWTPEGCALCLYYVQYLLHILQTVFTQCVCVCYCFFLLGVTERPNLKFQNNEQKKKTKGGACKTDLETFFPGTILKTKFLCKELVHICLLLTVIIQQQKKKKYVISASSKIPKIRTIYKHVSWKSPCSNKLSPTPNLHQCFCQG